MTMECVEEVWETKNKCGNKKCRYWINYPEDLNCTHLAIYKNKEGMNLKEIGKRIDITGQRVLQIEKESIKKIGSSASLLRIINE